MTQQTGKLCEDATFPLMFCALYSYSINNLAYLLIEHLVKNILICLCTE